MNPTKVNKDNPYRWFAALCTLTNNEAYNTSIVRNQYHNLHIIKVLALLEWTMDKDNAGKSDDETAKDEFLARPLEELLKEKKYLRRTLDTMGRISRESRDIPAEMEQYKKNKDTTLEYIKDTQKSLADFKVAYPAAASELTSDLKYLNIRLHRLERDITSPKPI